jgi:N-acetylmuramoyl-L-alanine amidase
MKKTASLLMAIVIIASCIISCARNPYAAANKSYKKQAKVIAKRLRALPGTMATDSAAAPPYVVATTNFDIRRPNFVIIHHTAQNSCEQTLKTFTMDRTKVSAHYVICKDGTIHHMLSDYLRAWQAGVSRWGNATDINSLSVGIEIDNNGFEPFADKQIASLLVVLDSLKKKYNIPATNFIGHADIAPGRKVDPNAYFPWQTLAEKGFGMWYDTTATIVPDNFNAIQALRIIGYNVKDSIAAIHSFKLHFVQQDSTRELNDASRKILYELYGKYQ